jgi:hypothetical protein
VEVTIMSRCSMVLLWLAAAGVAADLRSGETRGIVPEQVVQARPKPSSAGNSAARPSYQAVAPLRNRQGSSPLQPGKQLGLSIWRLRPANAGDRGARILVHENANTAEWIPERVASGASLRAGDYVRLTVESPDSGYLYVIDRERYASGERGAPHLIFPTSGTRGGDNRVSAGQLIDIPAQTDRPSFFTLRNSRPDQLEEELTILVTREPLEGIEPGPEAVVLAEAQVAQWEKRWGMARVDRFELSGGAGRTWTRAEQQAGADKTRILTQDDPPPQTVYRVAAGRDEPVMVKVRLRYSRSR